jgi:hypothetical protein
VSDQSPAAEPSGPSGSWAVYRIVDNANVYPVRGGLTRGEAERLAAEFQARGHKQTYWVEWVAGRPPSGS